MIQKLYLYVIITVVFFYISRQYNHVRTNKHLIKLLFNDVKNLTSILSCCIGPKCVSSNDDTKALFLCELYFLLDFTSRPLNHQRTNNQRIIMT